MDVVDAGGAFLARSRYYLSEEYLPKIVRSLEHLTDEDIWWRPNEASNSIGNLLLHLAGNVRQWIVSGLGGETDRRIREAEFDQRTPIAAAELVEALAATVREADKVLAGLDPSRLLQPCRIQGFDVTVLGAVYHVVEHFGMHTGQITLIAKQRRGADLGLTVLPDPDPRPATG